MPAVDGTQFDVEAKDCALQAQNRLASIPLLCKRDITKEIKIPSALSLCGENCCTMEAHLAAVGIDNFYFSHTTEEQSMYDGILVTICT
jgi:hypothetical protein